MDDRPNFKRNNAEVEDETATYMKKKKLKKFFTELAMDDVGFRLNPKGDLTTMLDNAEMTIETIRKEALKMAEDLENVNNSVECVRNSKLLDDLSDVDKEEIYQFANRIIDRCETVNISVLTTRSDSQQNCLEEINKMIDRIVKTLTEDPDNAKSMCQAYIASCSSSGNELGCKVFETAVLGCTLDDQKCIIKRLKGLLNYIIESKGK
uniref:BAG family molecular chaperone regulator 2 n=1 Tax=Schizaphis graminum TaxID=13262 RepID=A0A2S2NPC9_SCHGA